MPWQYDPSKWFIWTLSKLGFAWDLHRTPEERILQAKAEVLEQKIQMNPQNVNYPAIVIAKEQFENAFNQFISIKKQSKESYDKAKDIIKEKQKQLIQAYKNYEKIISNYAKQHHLSFQD